MTCSSALRDETAASPYTAEDRRGLILADACREGCRPDRREAPAMLDLLLARRTARAQA